MIWGFIQLLTLIGLFFGVIWVTKYLAQKFPPLAVYWDNEVIPICLALITFHLGLYWIFPNFWVHWYEGDGFIFYQLLFWFGVYMATRPKKILKTSGYVLVILGIIGFGFGILDARAESSKLNKKEDVQQEVVDFWQKNRPKQAKQMIAIADRVSQFNQYEEDSITTLRSKKEGYACVMQIDEEWWAPQAEVLGYDINSVNGCLNMALWIREHQGVEAWSDNDEVRKKANHKKIVVVAPVPPYWSEKIAVPGEFLVAEDGNITIQTYDEMLHDDGPGKDSPPIRSKWLRFQSKNEKETVRVTVSREK